MKKEEKLKVTVDILIFARHFEKPCILLVKRRHPPFEGKWAIPGGFVEEDETLEQAAQRELAEETVVRDVTVEQLSTFGDPGRDPRGRTITIAYLAVIGEAVKVQAGSDAKEARWFAVDELPELAFDHRKILAMGLERVGGC